MLPQSIRRQLQTDNKYESTRQMILNSKTTIELFNNSTALNNWSYMMPGTLEYLLKDIKNDDIHQKIYEYKSKLMAFNSSTKLRDLQHELCCTRLLHGANHGGGRMGR